MSRPLFFLLLAVFAALHHDFWFWDDPSLVGGVLPVGLAYHAAYCLVSAAIWALAVRTIWPLKNGRHRDPAPAGRNTGSGGQRA